MLIDATFQQANKGKSYVMHTNEFGPDMYIADQSKCNILVTDKIEEAEVWSVDNDAIKIEYYRSITGYDLKPIII